MKKRYYVKYYRNFSNTYNLAWADDPVQESEIIAAGYERISRKKALSLCVAENRRRKENSNFAYFANNKILPYGKSEYELDYQTGYIWE